MANQEIFHTVYRGRQSRWHHIAYMRTGKVFAILQALDKVKINLKGAAILDYGFGAGTFLRHCPKDAEISGVELDAQTVAETERMLTERGHCAVRLQTIEISTWKQNPLLQEKYDVLVCSHVLEHLDDPVDFLRRMKECLNENGVLVGLVPINERKANPQHVQIVDEKKVQAWAAESGLRVNLYVENDPWFYWLQPLFSYNSGWRQKLTRVASFGIGLAAASFGFQNWENLSRTFQRLSLSKPTQAAFVLSEGLTPGASQISTAIS